MVLKRTHTAGGHADGTALWKVSLVVWVGGRAWGLESLGSDLQSGFNLLVSLCLRSDTLECKECDALMNAQHTGNEMSLPLIILLGFKSHKAFYMLLT